MWMGSLSHYLIFASYVYNMYSLISRCTKAQSLLSCRHCTRFGTSLVLRRPLS